MKKVFFLFLSAILLVACSKATTDPLEDPNSENPMEDPPANDPTADDPTADPSGDFVVDSFDTNGPLIDYITNNAASLPNVTSENGRYKAVLADNSGNITLHFNQRQGRIDAKAVSFPFEFIARNIGIGTMADTQTAPAPENTPFVFCGVQVHVVDFNSINSSHVVVGHRGGTAFTVEGKNTLNGSSNVNDVGSNTVPDGRADIRIVGTEDHTLVVYWQTPNMAYATTADNWNLYRDSGNLPGTAPSYDADVYIGLITYAYGNDGVPFVGTCDAIQIKD